MSARGHFVWHELLTTDIKAAAGFYGKVGGWTTQEWKENKGYLLFMTGKAVMAGLKREEPRRWLPYIVTDDVEVALWEAQRLGGKVIKNTDTMPTVGKFAVLQDPFGAVFAVLQPAYEPKPTYPVSVGDFSWHELLTADVDVALRFYSALFGWQKTSAMDMGAGAGLYQMFGWKGRELGGVYKKAKQDPGPNRWVCYIKVRDAETAAEAATKAGGKIQMDPMKVAGGTWIATGLDPQGAEFSVHSDKKAKAKPAAKKKAAKKPAKKKTKSSKGKKRK
ncbi:MAG: VOC family protein [Gemmatimonadetes bacterium]|nr:VOC family protein [Gemmatimonadota bacterium]